MPILLVADATVVIFQPKSGVLIQEMIWQRSAKSLLLFGPQKICEALAKEPWPWKVQRMVDDGSGMVVSRPMTHT